ncbi:hypothetical protein BAUCODRAFT_33183 [Baudoinia panamericana UAMH 10762]|uniref:GPI anchored protein n=1 Tax=Baudoinia panamericana (strain UAMH 10762) TaxID=717646 RepID=M2LSL2_BAUPA|nr:uncharacterized protein BAUCODRAFT_33183 [Baudoinia panamericana UAMH 10762]EMC97467.1 hypothetical protein BAUCODRAFT_33183 [Baudoinia panamericana UAMH 10762]
MRHLDRLLLLPSGLLALLVCFRVDAQHVARTGDSGDKVNGMQHSEQLRWQVPLGIRKMSEDEGEKFWPHYWDFGEEPAHLLEEAASLVSSNLSLGRAPIAPHTNHGRSLSILGRSIFARAFQCPTNTTSCSSLGSDLCCPTGESCVTNSSGSICCCPAGQSCTSASCSSCAAGYTSCPNSPNGGCCIPGAVCAGTGCVFVGTQTTVVTLPTSTVTATISSSRSISSSTTPTPTTASIAPAAVTSVSISTVTVTQSISGAMTTIIQPVTVLITPTTSTTTISPSSQSSLVCSSGYQSCAASLGGGCCPNGQICAASNLCVNATTSTISAGAPILPTSDSTTTASVSAASVASTATTNDICPTGYYVCSAYYMGGCCRVGRDCDTTSCPSSESTAIISSGATVVVPYTSTTVVGGGTTTAASPAGSQGSCANGWYSCPASASGGCCPSEYVCGAVSCSATVSGQQNTGKVSPSQASAVRWAAGFMFVTIGSAVGMIWL